MAFSDMLNLKNAIFWKLLGVTSSNFQNCLVFMIPTTGESLKKIWEVWVTWSGWFGMQLPSFVFSLNTFKETNSSSLIYESTKALEIRTSIVSNLALLSNTILSCFFFLLFLNNWLIRFDSCNDCRNVYSYCRTCNTSRNTVMKQMQKLKHNQ